MILTGNEKAVWLIRVLPGDDGEPVFDVVAKPAGGRWKWIDQKVPGTPAAAAAMEDNLHLLLQPTGYLIFDLERGDQQVGLNPNDPHWPQGTGPLALCQAPAFGASKTATMLAIVPRPPGPVSGATQPATSTQPTAPAASRPQSVPALVSMPSTAGAGGRSNLAVFQTLAAQWSYLTELEGIPLTDDTHIAAAVVGDHLYVLISTPGGNRLVAWRKGQPWQDVPLKGLPASGKALSMLNVSSRLAILLAVEPSGGPSTQPHSPRELHIFTMGGDGSFSDQAVTQNGAAMTWAADGLPLSAGLADQLALLWRQGRQINFATCNLTGELLPVSVVDIFERLPIGVDGFTVMQYFMWGLLASIFVTMFLFRPGRVPKPFSLPPDMRPSPILKRLAAGLVDFIPFVLLGSVGFILTTPVMTPEEIQAMLTSFAKERPIPPIPTNLAYSMIISMGVYVVYCVGMEQRFSATAGKMLLGIRLVADEGARPGLREIALRNLLNLFVLMWLPLLLLIPLFTRNRQGLSDMIARTTVVDTAPHAPPPMPPPPPRPDDPASPSDWG